MAADNAAPTVLLAVGDELLSGHTQDTNSNFLARTLFAAGYPVRRIEVLPDHDDAIVAAIRRARSEPGVTRIVVSGGIGPTPDDHTFAAVAKALGRPLEENADAMRHIAGIVQRMFDAGWVQSAEVSEANRRSALIPQGSRVLENRRGMAPAVAIPLEGDSVLFVLPGIPRELTAIVEEELVPRYFSDGSGPLVREVHYTATPEAEMYEPMRVLGREFPDVSVGSYPQSERRRLVIRLRGNDATRVDAAAARLREMMPEG